MSARSSVHSFQGSSHPYRGWVTVAVIHIFIGYALISGMAQKGLHLIKKPLEAVVIQEVVIPPPPPPPKKIEKPQEMPKAPPPPYVPPSDTAPSPQAPTIAAVSAPPKEPAVIAPPPPPKALTGRQDIGVVCPTQVPPTMPARAIRDGIEGVVKAQVTILNGEIKEVAILSGNRVFHSAVKEAMMQYKCKSIASEVTATQEFSFKIE
jgi:periplasmic protein TonB